MTFKEKLAKEHPDKVDQSFGYICKGCPSHYCYETDPPCNDSDITCTDCWNREIPGTEPTSVSKEEGTRHIVMEKDPFDRDDILKLLYEAIKLPHKTVSIFVGESGTNISIFDSEGESND